jgi:hypothetical protein
VVHEGGRVEQARIQRDNFTRTEVTRKAEETILGEIRDLLAKQG